MEHVADAVLDHHGARSMRIAWLLRDSLVNIRIKRHPDTRDLFALVFAQDVDKLLLDKLHACY